MKKENNHIESLIIKKGKLFISLLLLSLLTWGCVDENEDEMILGLWEIENLSLVRETLAEVYTPTYTVNFEDIGRIFFRANGEGVLQIYDEKYPNFEYHDIGVTHFTWHQEGDELYIDGRPGLITEKNWRKFSFEIITINEGTRDRMVYELKSKIIQ